MVSCRPPHLPLVQGFSYSTFSRQSVAAAQLPPVVHPMADLVQEQEAEETFYTKKDVMLHTFGSVNSIDKVRYLDV